MRYFLLFQWLIFLLLPFSTSLCGEEAAKKQAGPVLESIFLNEATMQDAARLITMASGLPLVVSAQAAPVKVSIFLRNISATNAVEAICRANAMWHKRDRNTGIVQIQSMNELRQEMQIRRDEYAEAVDILYPPAADIADSISQLFADRVYWIRPNDDNFTYDRIQNAFDRMDILSTRGTFDTTGNTSSGSSTGTTSNSTSNSTSSGSSSQSGSSGTSSGGSRSSRASKNSISLDKISSLADLLQKIPEGRLRLLYEQFGLKSQGGTVQQIAGAPGIVFISVMQDSNVLLLRSYDQDALQQIKQLVKSLDRPSPQVLLEVKILIVTLNDSQERAIDFLFSYGDVSGGFANGLTSAGNGQEILKPDSNFIPQGTGLSPSAANITAVTQNFSMRAQLLQKDGRLTRLASPNLLVADNEASKLFVGSEVTVMEKAQKTVSYTTSANIQNPNISWEIDAPRRRIGISLVITPKIHADRSVTIRLLQEHSSLGSLRYSTYAGSSSDSDGSDEEQSETTVSSSSSSSNEYFISQDINMQSLTTTTVAQDRQVVLIGGMIEERMEKNLDKIPGLGNIPWLGELLFSRSEQERVREEILVVIRPYVLLAPGEAEDPSLKLMRKLSQHPSATPSLPPLGVSLPEEQAKPDWSAPDDPWTKKLWHDIEGWHIDTSTDPRVQQAIFEYQEKLEREKAEKRINKMDENIKEKKED